MSCSASSSLAFATFADGLDPLLNRIDLVFAAITLAILVLGHIAFIVIAWVARRFELSKLGKTRDERRRMNKEGNDGDSRMAVGLATAPITRSISAALPEYCALRSVSPAASGQSTDTADGKEDMPMISLGSDRPKARLLSQYF